MSLKKIWGYETLEKSSKISLVSCFQFFNRYYRTEQFQMTLNSFGKVESYYMCEKDL